MEVAVGAIFLLVSLIILLQALIVALVKLGLGPGWASLLVGVVIAIIGAVFVKRGTTNMSSSELALTRTADQLRKDANLAQEQTR